MDHDDDRHEKHGGKHDHGDDDEPREDDHGHDNHHQHRYFRSGDAACLRQYYTGPIDLPPGLRKKYYRTGTLPPGWEKRFRALPPVVVQQLPPPPPNCERGYMDGYAVVYDRRTRVIVDILDVLSVNVTLGR
jgi:hypothetical protein